MKKIKVMTVFGTRPEAIKMAPLIKVLEEQSQGFDSVVVVTAQHRQMLDQVLEDFQITPNHDLNIMKDGQTLTDITSRVLNLLTEVLVTEQPDIVLVHGDTTTSFAAALAAFYSTDSSGTCGSRIADLAKIFSVSGRNESSTGRCVN